jgi:DNA polymerase Ligase (LigD)
VSKELWAGSHHFDFRLEKDGVSKSWVVPEGLGLNRLAVQVDDHALEFGSSGQLVAVQSVWILLLPETGSCRSVCWQPGRKKNECLETFSENMLCTATLISSEILRALRASHSPSGA